MTCFLKVVIRNFSHGYGFGTKRDLYECARFIPIQEVWRMERRRK